MNAKDLSDAQHVSNLVILIARLVQQVRNNDPENDVATKAMDYLKRADLQPSMLRGVTENISKPAHSFVSNSELKELRAKAELGEAFGFFERLLEIDGQFFDASRVRETGEINLSIVKFPESLVSFFANTTRRNFHSKSLLSAVLAAKAAIEKGK